MQIDPIYWKVWWWAIHNNYDIKTLMDSISPSQMESKHWLVDNLPIFKNDIDIQLYGGWYGYPMIELLLNQLNVRKITNLDIDEQAILLCQRFSNEKDLKDSVVQKVYDVNLPYVKDPNANLVINTSSEHMQNMKDIINKKEYQKDCCFAIQSNNMFHIHDHINCVNSVDELVEKSGIQKIHYSGTLEMPNGYERYMVIGWLSI